MTAGMIMISGMLIVAGAVLLVFGSHASTPHLADTVAALYQQDTPTRTHRTGRVTGSGSAASERFGGWLYRRTPIPLGQRQLQTLQIRGVSVASFYADKAVWALVGLTVPAGMFAVTGLLVTQVPWSAPVLASLIGMAAGFFVPDLTIRGQAKARRSDASAALLMYIDLVTLERLSNASGTQALHNAAELSDVALFRHIRGALQRAWLEQQTPYPQLRRLATELGLPELVDLADVMQMDESGAALSGSLRARVAELRDAQLAKSLREANAASEGMTIYMSIPALLFVAIIITPALLNILTG
jgi:hypothetical protein